MNNPFQPIPQRPARNDDTWERRNDPTFREVILRDALRQVRRRG